MFIEWCALHGFGLSGWPEGAHKQLVAHLNEMQDTGLAKPEIESLREILAGLLTMFRDVPDAELVNKALHQEDGPAWILRARHAMNRHPKAAGR